MARGKTRLAWVVVLAMCALFLMSFLHAGFNESGEVVKFSRSLVEDRRRCADVACPPRLSGVTVRRPARRALPPRCRPRCT